jgi:hypothetical protein
MRWAVPWLLVFSECCRLLCVDNVVDAYVDAINLLKYNTWRMVACLPYDLVDLSFYFARTPPSKDFYDTDRAKTGSHRMVASPLLTIVPVKSR